MVTLRSAETVLRDASKIAADRNVTIYAVDSRTGSAPVMATSGMMDAGSGGGNTSFQTVLGNSGPRVTSAGVRSTTLQGDAGQHAHQFTIEESAAMEHLARATGGVYFHEGSDMLKQLRSAVADGRAYYL